MKKLLVWTVGCVAVLALACSSVPVRAEDSKESKDRIFELRTYVTHSGKLEALHKRFREHTLELFKKHGIEVVAFWTPTKEPECQDTLIYIVAFPSVEAQKKAWQGFRDDPEWQKAFKESHKDGVIVKKVETVNLKAVDYSPIK